MRRAADTPADNPAGKASMMKATGIRGTKSRQGTFPNEAERLMVQKMPLREADEFGNPKPVWCHRVKLPVDVILRAGRLLSEKTSCAAVSREPPSQFNSYISDLQR
jgi:hypothetical protein